MEKSSPVAKSMLLWVKAMYDFYFVNRRVKPKKIALAEAEEKSSKLQGELDEKKKNLKIATDKVD